MLRSRGRGSVSGAGKESKSHDSTIMGCPKDGGGYRAWDNGIRGLCLYWEVLYEYNQANPAILCGETDGK